jgi:hypothetical protein
VEEMQELRPVEEIQELRPVEEMQELRPVEGTNSGTRYQIPYNTAKIQNQCTLQ